MRRTFWASAPDEAGARQAAWQELQRAPRDPFAANVAVHPDDLRPYGARQECPIWKIVFDIDPSRRPTADVLRVEVEIHKAGEERA